MYTVDMTCIVLSVYVYVYSRLDLCYVCMFMYTADLSGLYCVRFVFCFVLVLLGFMVWFLFLFFWGRCVCVFFNFFFFFFFFNCFGVCFFVCLLFVFLPFCKTTL